VKGVGVGERVVADGGEVLDLAVVDGVRTDNTTLTWLGLPSTSAALTR